MLFNYGRRKAHGEQKTTSKFGFKTWWLTQETHVRSATDELVREKGASYIMRPEFLMNFIALSPSMVEVRKIYEKVFPTLLGIKLSGRMKHDVYKNLLLDVARVTKMDEARAAAMMEKMANKLKAYEYQQFQKDIEAGRKN